MCSVNPPRLDGVRIEAHHLHKDSNGLTGLLVELEACRRDIVDCMNIDVCAPVNDWSLIIDVEMLAGEAGGSQVLDSAIGEPTIADDLVPFFALPIPDCTREGFLQAVEACLQVGQLEAFVSPQDGGEWIDSEDIVEVRREWWYSSCSFEVVPEPLGLRRSIGTRELALKSLFFRGYGCSLGFAFDRPRPICKRRSEWCIAGDQ